MAMVVTYWQLLEDEKEFLAFLNCTGAVLALPTCWVQSKDELIPEPIASFIERYRPRQLFVTLDRYMQQIGIETHILDGTIRFSIPQMSSPVLCYDRVFPLGGKFGRSNLSAYSAYPDESANAIVKKSPEFLTWSKKVFAWVRKMTPEQMELRGFRYRATTRAKLAAADGALELVL